MKDFIRRRGLAPLFFTFFWLAVLVFVVLYGERLNPWDGITWSEYHG